MRLVVTPRAWAAFAACWALLGAGVLLANPGLAFGGLALGLAWASAVLGASKGRMAGRFACRIDSLSEEQATPIDVRISNGRRTPELVEWQLALPGLGEVRSGRDAGAVIVPGRGEHAQAFELGLRMFGLHRAGPLRVRTTDALGLAATEAEVAPTQELRVHPRRGALDELAARAKQKRSLLGLYEVPMHGHGFEFQGLRDYVPGDRPRDVNWKASARAGRHIVNQREKENDTEIVLLVDARAATKVGLLDQSPFARGVRTALAAAEAHLRARDAVRFVAYGARLHQDLHAGAVRHLAPIQELVTDLEPEGDMPLAEVVHTILPELHAGSPVILFSPLVGDDSVPGALGVLAARGFRPQCVVLRPAWRDHAATPGARAWAAAQAQAEEALRRAGVRSAALEPGSPPDEPFTILRTVR